MVISLLRWYQGSGAPIPLFVEIQGWPVYVGQSVAPYLVAELRREAREEWKCRSGHGGRYYSRTEMDYKDNTKVAAKSYKPTGDPSTLG